MTEKKFKVIGMHCPACEHVVGKLLKNQKGVRSAHVDRRLDQAILDVNEERFSLDKTNKALEQSSYSLVPIESHVESPMRKVWTTVFICAVLVSLVWMLTSGTKFDFFDVGKLTDNVGISSAFVLGLIASISSCLAVTGGLLLALTANIPDARKWNFSISFAIGRLLSYTILGGLLGLIGEKLSLSTTVSAILTIIVSVIMLFLGLQLLGLFKMPSFIPKRWVHGIENMTKNPNQTAIEAGIVGALTFFLPCGFTQALQLFALQSGSFTTGASILFMFALGTLPVLLFVGSITKYISPVFRSTAMKVAGVIVIALAIISIPSALTLYSAGGSSVVSQSVTTSAVPEPIVTGGIQEITTTVKGFDYSPDVLTVKAGIPVKWTVNGQGATGCAKSFVAPAFGVRKVLSSTAPTIIEFTPTKKGAYKFTCSMGMAGPGTINVI
jgi:uncharacterized protein